MPALTTSQKSASPGKLKTFPHGGVTEESVASIITKFMVAGFDCKTTHVPVPDRSA